MVAWSVVLWSDVYRGFMI